MAVGDIAVMRLVGRYQLQNVVNTLHYEIIEQPAEQVDQWQVLADDWATANATLWLGRHVDEYTLIGIKVFTRAGQTLPPGFATIGTAGSVVAAGNDALVCRTITLYSTNPNYRVRGRLQLSGGAQTMFDVTTGEVTQTEVDALDTLGAQLLQDINETLTHFKMVLWNPTLLQKNDLVEAKGRVTPSVIRSRRARQFNIG